MAVSIGIFELVIAQTLGRLHHIADQGFLLRCFASWNPGIEPFFGLAGQWVALPVLGNPKHAH